MQVHRVIPTESTGRGGSLPVLSVSWLSWQFQLQGISVLLFIIIFVFPLLPPQPGAYLMQEEFLHSPEAQLAHLTYSCRQLFSRGGKCPGLARFLSGRVEGIPLP